MLKKKCIAVYKKTYRPCFKAARIGFLRGRVFVIGGLLEGARDGKGELDTEESPDGVSGRNGLSSCSRSRAAGASPIRVLRRAED